MSRYVFATTAPASRPRSKRSCSNRFSPPSRPAKAPGSASGSAMTSAPSSTAAWRHDHRRQPRGRIHRIHGPTAAFPAGRNLKDGNLKDERMSFSILVVDDEPDVAEMFRQRFRHEARQGTYVMHFAASGEEALDRLADGVRAEVIVILAGINMPGMDGLSLLREIKTRRPDLPVMMVTAYGDDERRRQAAEAGALQFLTKPVDFDLLKEELRRLSGAST